MFTTADLFFLYNTFLDTFFSTALSIHFFLYTFFLYNTFFSIQLFLYTFFLYTIFYTTPFFLYNFVYTHFVYTHFLYNTTFSIQFDPGRFYSSKPGPEERGVCHRNLLSIRVRVGLPLHSNSPMHSDSSRYPFVAKAQCTQTGTLTGTN